MTLQSQFRLHYGEGGGKKAEAAFNLFRLGKENNTMKSKGIEQEEGK